MTTNHEINPGNATELVKSEDYKEMKVHDEQL